MAIDLEKYKLDTPAVDLSKYKLDTQPISDQSLSDKIWSSITQRGQKLSTELSTPTESPISTGIKATSQAFGAVGDVVGNILESTPVISPIVKKAGEIAQKGFSKAVDYASPIGQKLAELEQSNPEQAKLITDFLEGAGSLGDISGNILLAEGIRGGATKIPETITKGGQVASDLYKTLTTQSEKQIENNIIKGFEKGVRPLLPGKTTPTKAIEYKQDIIDAVKVIKDNRPNLQFKDDLGDIIEGQTPKTLQQFSESIEQTKRQVFNKYDALAKKAGDAGLEIDAPSIVNELDTVINNKALSLTNPKAIEYAKDIQDRYKTIGKIDAETAQEVIKNYNNSLEAFYKNPSYDNASQAAIDALVANKIRTALDEGISGITGERYQVLKNQYGSLKAIERDVVKAALRDARKNVKGLIDYTDIFTGGQIVNGLLNLNPGQFATGVAQRGIKEWFKFLNDPNRAIENVFKTVEKLP